MIQLPLAQGLRKSKKNGKPMLLESPLILRHLSTVLQTTISSTTKQTNTLQKSQFSQV